MEAFADVFFEMGTGDADPVDSAFEFEFQVAVDGKGEVVLGDLVILGHVRVEVVFAIELGTGGDLAMEEHAGQDGQPDGFFVGYRQHPR